MDIYQSSSSVGPRTVQAQDTRQQQQQPYRHLQVVAPVQRSRSQGNLVLLQEQEGLLHDSVGVVDSEEAMTPEDTYFNRRALSPDSCTIRRSNKPLMEKKRRQRINKCLNDLKSLVFEAVKRDPSQYNKLEKADILEMTVRHVQVLHRQEEQFRTLMGNDEETKYRAGFTHCTSEVTKFLRNMEHDIPMDLHNKITKHLNTVVTPVLNVNSVNSVNDCSANVKNNVHVTTSSQPPQVIWLVQPQPQVNAIPVRLPMAQVVSSSTALPGNSMAAQPSIMVLPTHVNNKQFYDNRNTILSEQHTNNLISSVNSLNNGTMSLVLPSGFSIISNTDNANQNQPNNIQLVTMQHSAQEEVPVLAAIHKSNKNKRYSREYHSSVISSNISDCHSRLDSEDNSDSDVNSRVSSPVSFMSSPVSFMSMSPVPDDRTNSPDMISSSNGSDTLFLQTNHFREEIGSSVGAIKYNSCKGQPTLAPKPSYGNSTGSSFTSTGSGSSRPTSKVSPRISSPTSKASPMNESHKGRKSSKSYNKSSHSNQANSLPILIPPQSPKEVLDDSTKMWRPW